MNRPLHYPRWFWQRSSNRNVYEIIDPISTGVFKVACVTPCLKTMERLRIGYPSYDEIFGRVPPEDTVKKDWRDNARRSS